jgi:hypothetical protein
MRMDNIKHKQPDSVNLTQDDMDMLTTVLKRVRGSYPDTPYQYQEFVEEPEA